MIKTAMLMAAMTALFGFVGTMLGGFEGLLIAIILAIAVNLFAWYNSDKMVLRMYGAKEVPRGHQDNERSVQKKHNKLLIFY